MPIILTNIVPGNVIEFRSYATWKNQEIISKFYAYASVGTGPSLDPQGALLLYRTLYRLAFRPVTPPEFVVREYWCGIIHSVVRIVGPTRVRWLVSYTDQTIVLGDSVSDIGTSSVTDWCPTFCAVTMNRYGAARTKNWRSSIRQCPVAEIDQVDGILQPAAIGVYNAAFINMKGNVTALSSHDVILTACLFSPALGVGKTHDHMDEAAQEITDWGANQLIGSQLTRKIRAAGY